jgi:hypothetical protein
MWAYQVNSDARDGPPEPGAPELLVPSVFLEPVGVALGLSDFTLLSAVFFCSSALLWLFGERVGVALAAFDFFVLFVGVGDGVRFGDGFGEGAAVGFGAGVLKGVGVGVTIGNTISLLAVCETIGVFSSLRTTDLISGLAEAAADSIRVETLLLDRAAASPIQTKLSRSSFRESRLQPTRRTPATTWPSAMIVTFRQKRASRGIGYC